jgi:predicted secreted protein
MTANQRLSVIAAVIGVAFIILWSGYILPTYGDIIGRFLGSLITPAAIYFIVWWITLFAVLPFGVRSQAESGEVVPGSDPGAPAIPNLKMKLVWTTIVSAVVFAVGALVYAYRLVTLDQLGTLFGLLP